MEEVLKQAIDRRVVEAAMIKLVIAHSLPLSAVAWPHLQALMMACNYAIESILPSSRARLPGMIEETFHCTKETLKIRLQNALSDIHFSVDMWTSPNKKAFLAIIAHFVDEDGVLRKAFLPLPQLRGSHGGELQAFYVSRIIDDYGIASKVGFFTGDNHGSNNKL